ncbi:hypothetical protein WJX82_009846 [Trebouxia sp. C0006]
MAEAEPSRSIVTLDVAKSNRSTCKATGEKIEKGEHRVGVEAYSGGHISMTWQKVVPFLEGCSLEYSKTNTGADKKTGQKFSKGDLRFVMTVKGSRILLSVKSAAEELKPVLAEANEFSLLSFKGLEGLQEGDREEYFNQFGVSKSDAKAYNKEHPPPAEQPASPPPAKKCKTVKAKAVKDEDSEEDQERASEEEEEQEEAADHAETASEQPKIGKKAVKVEEMSAYERERAEHIARNKERMAALHLPSLASSMAPKKEARPAKQRGISSKRHKAPVEEAPRRASLRQRGVQADGAAVDTEGRGGHITLVNGEAIPYSDPSEPAQPRERHPPSATDFSSLNGRPGTDAAFLDLLKAQTGPSLAGGKGNHPTHTQLSKLDLQENDVAKVTKNGIVHLAFHPCTDTLILAAADKSGHIGLWSVDADLARPSGSATKENEEQNHENEGQAEGQQQSVKGDKSDKGEGEDLEMREGDDDGVLELAPHYQYISGLRWAGGRGNCAKLVTASYDGSVRMLDPSTATFELLVTDPEAEYSAMDCLADASSGFVGDNEGNLQGFDARQKQLTQTALNIHDKKINTVNIEPGQEHLLATACSDNSICIWDVRKLSQGGKPVRSVSHSLTCQSAYFAPDGSQRVVSTSRDDTLRIWDARHDLSQLASMKHYNNTGRWVVPFRGVWGPASDTVIVGSMKRTIDVFNDEGGKMAQLSSEHQTAISSRHCVHPTLPVLAAGTASGRMHVYR